MFKKLKVTWHRFANREPGTRFRKMYDEHQKAEKSGFARVMYVAGGILIIAVGIVALPAPGPGMLVIALGAGLIARESKKLAGFLDRMEMKGRHWWARHRPKKKARSGA